MSASEMATASCAGQLCCRLAGRQQQHPSLVLRHTHVMATMTSAVNPPQARPVFIRFSAWGFHRRALWHTLPHQVREGWGVHGGLQLCALAFFSTPTHPLTRLLLSSMGAGGLRNHHFLSSDQRKVHLPAQSSTVSQYLALLCNKKLHKVMVFSIFWLWLQ